MAQMTSYFTTMIGMPLADPGFSRGCDIADVSCHHFGAFYANIYFLKNEKFIVCRQGINVIHDYSKGSYDDRKNS